MCPLIIEFWYRLAHIKERPQIPSDLTQIISRFVQFNHIYVCGKNSTSRLGNSYTKEHRVKNGIFQEYVTMPEIVQFHVENINVSVVKISAYDLGIICVGDDGRLYGMGSNKEFSFSVAACAAGSSECHDEI